MAFIINLNYRKMGASSLKLQWFPLKHYRELAEIDLLYPLDQRSGLYMWGFMDDKRKFWPYYVGKHRNVPFRLCEHLANLKGGNYNIYSVENLFSCEDKRFYNPVNLVHKIQFVAGEYNEDQTLHVNNMIERFHFTYCFLDNFKALGEKAEKTTLNCFSRWILINTSFGSKCDDIDIGNLFEVVDISWDNRDYKFDRAMKFRK